MKFQVNQGMYIKCRFYRELFLFVTITYLETGYKNTYV